MAPYSRDLLSVTAVSNSESWSVGAFGDAGFPAWRSASGLRPLVVHEVNAVWKLASSPKMTQPSALFGVDAIDANQVWAVGANGKDALIERYDGTSWTQVPGAATAKTATLYAVSGVDRNHVWAVGTDGTSPLIEEWDGAQWTNVAPASTDCPGPVSLQSVAAVSTTDVWAVGTCRIVRHAINDTELIEHWDGTSWTESLRNRVTLGLWSVSASGPDDVWAVGDTRHSVAEHFDGASWSTVSLPKAVSHGVDAVAAVSPTDVTVVGGDALGPYVAHWDGTSWVREPVAGTAHLSEGELESVAGTPGGGTVAVGHDYHGAAQPADFTLTLGVASTDSILNWAKQATPEPGAANVGVLAAIDVDSANDAWAVGSNPYRGRSLVEHWNGTSWSVSKPASTTLKYTVVQFDGVAAIAPKNVWAVGALAEAGSERSAALIEHWNGNSWKEFPAPQVGGDTGDDAVTSVDALAPDDVWAAGGDSYGGILFVLHFDGSSWTTVYQSAKNVGTATGIVALAADDVWVVGGGSSSHGGPIALHWDGTSWTSQVSGLPSGYYQRLAGVTAADGAVLAGGNAFDDEASWTGAAWQPMANPSPPAGREGGIAADSATDAWAVGQTETSDNGKVQTMRWDGSQWSTVPITSPGVHSFLRAVYSSSPSSAWAVGRDSVSTGMDRPLIEQWDGSTWAVQQH